MECGSLFGRSASEFLERCRVVGISAQVWCIDTWEWCPEPAEFRKVLSDEDYVDFCARISKVGLRSEAIFDFYMSDTNVNKIKCDAAVCAESFEDGTIDFVFLDAFHDYQSVKEQIAAWTPKVRLGGFIGGDDFNGEGLTRGVKKAIFEKFDHCDVFDLGADFRTSGEYCSWYVNIQ